MSKSAIVLSILCFTFSSIGRSETSYDLKKFVCHPFAKNGEQNGNSHLLYTNTIDEAVSALATLLGFQKSVDADEFRKLPEDAQEIVCNNFENVNIKSNSKALPVFTCIVFRGSGSQRSVEVRASSLELAIENLEALGGSFVIGHPEPVSIECTDKQNKKVSSKDLKTYYCQGGVRGKFDSTVFKTRARTENSAMASMSVPVSLRSFNPEEGGVRDQVKCQSEHPNAKATPPSTKSEPAKSQFQ